MMPHTVIEIEPGYLLSFDSEDGDLYVRDVLGMDVGIAIRVPAGAESITVLLPLLRDLSVHLGALGVDVVHEVREALVVELGEDDDGGEEVSS